MIAYKTGGSQCPYCSGRNFGEDNNLAVRHPHLIKEWHPTKNGDLTPYDVTQGSNIKVWWRCNKGHEWEATIANRAWGKGCPYCAGIRVEKDNT